MLTPPRDSIDTPKFKILENIVPRFAETVQKSQPLYID